MKGLSSATRRYRGLPTSYKRPLSSSLPIGCDDHDDRDKKRRSTRHLLPFIFLRRVLASSNPLSLKGPYLWPAICLCVLTLWTWTSGYSRRLPLSLSFAPLRSTSRRRLDNLETQPSLHIPSFGVSRVLLPAPLTRLAWEGGFGRHFGGLDLHVFEPSACPSEGCQRQIFQDYSLSETRRDRQDPEEGTYDNYYAFDDDRIRNPYVRYSKKEEDLEKRCRRVSWYRHTPINCNNLHELDFRSATGQGNSQFVGAGAYRQVYLTDVGSESFILKKFGLNSAYDMADFEYMRMDSIVAERLSARKEIVDIYAFCGLANLNEPMLNGNLESVALPNGVRAPEVQLHDEEHLDPQNRLLPSQKLGYSLEMAEAVSVLHSFPGGVMVHDDIQMSQFLFTSSMHLVLNDFNRAEIMTFNEDENEYCRYTNNPGHGDWRAPEEYHDYPLNEKIDVYSLGNCFYSMLTGVGVFYDEADIEQVQRRVKAGETPYIDPRWRERSFAEGKLIEVMQKMWTYNPDERIDIFEVISFLRDALEETYRSYMHEDKL